jgi:hypothetical protein
MHGGNGMEIYWRDNFICPTEKEYLDVICPSKLDDIVCKNLFNVFIYFRN